MAGAGETVMVDGVYAGNNIIGYHKLRDVAPGEGQRTWADDWGDNIRRSDAATDAGVGSARSGVDAILGRQGDVDASIGAMRGDAGRMEGLAGELGGMGHSMFESGTKVTDQALETLGTGLGFIRMDSSSSPLVAEALKLYGEFDPDRYVATAAQDVQSSADNARGQTERSLARMGVNPSSGAAMSARSTLEKSLAVAKAAAMTRARERGKNDLATAFQNLIVNPGNTFLQTGGQLASIGSSMSAQGANALGNAGNLLGDAGRLHGTAGSLSLDFGNSLMKAYNALAGVQLDKAKLAQGTASQVLQWSGKGGGGGGSTSTGRHYGVGGELLETGNPQVDAQLQMARDAQPTTYEKNLGLA